MGRPPADHPIYDEEEDRKRLATINLMMQQEPELYWGDGGVQREWRDATNRLNGIFEPEPVPEADVSPLSPEKRARKAEIYHVMKTNCPLYDRLYEKEYRGLLEEEESLKEGKPATDFMSGVVSPAAAKPVGMQKFAQAGPPQPLAPPAALVAPAAGANATTIASPPQNQAAAAPPLKFSERYSPKELLFNYYTYSQEMDRFAKANNVGGTIHVVKNGVYEPKDSDPESSNAFAHAAMSALYAYDRGDKKAKSVGDHQERANVLSDEWKKVGEALTLKWNDPLVKAERDSLKLDIYRDLFNNAAGRDIGNAAKAAGLPRSEVLRLVLEALRAGKLILDQHTDPRVDKSFNGNPSTYRPPAVLK